MAIKSLTVVRPGRYGTRMLRAGDVYEATAPEARLYAKLGWMRDLTDAEAIRSDTERMTAAFKPKAVRKPRKRSAKKK